MSGWTTDTLHSHLLRILTETDLRYQQRYESQQKAITDALLAQKEAVSAALAAADRALVKAEMASEKRFEGVNEFRATLSDQASHLMPRGETITLVKGLTDKVADLTDRVNRAEGKGSGIATTWAVVVAVGGMAVGIIGVILAWVSK